MEVEQRGDDLVIRVLDRGPGIAEADRGRLFEPFFNGTGVSGGSGRTGLGLSITDSIVRKHGGTLEFDDAPGGGTVATLRLPLHGAG